MSQPNDLDLNGPSPGIEPNIQQEGVKVVHGNNSSPPQQQQQYQYVPQTQQPQQQNFTGPRPVLRRTDSRSSIQFRPPGPNPNQPSPQGGVRQQIPGPQQGPPQGPPGQPRPPIQAGNYYGPRPIITPGPRFTPPGQQPVRYAPEQSDANFRRIVNTVAEGNRFQRPPQPGPRPPGTGIYPQKPSTVPPSTGGEGLRKSYTVDNSEVNVGMASEQNGSSEKLLQLKAQNGSSEKINMQGKVQPQSFKTDSEKYKYDDMRPSSALGFVDPEKDVDTALNGKSREEIPERPDSRIGNLGRNSSSREEISERPDSRTGLSRNNSSHSSMLKIDEDDDDAVITPSRQAYASGGIRSGKSTPMSNSSDNVSQKSVDIGESHRPIKSPSPAHSDSPEIKKSPYSSVTNISSSDIDKKFPYSSADVLETRKKSFDEHKPIKTSSPDIKQSPYSSVTNISNSPEIRKSVNSPDLTSTEVKKTPTPSIRNSTENISLKSLDIDPSKGLTASKQKSAAETRGISPRITPEPQKPNSLTPQNDNVNRSPSPSTKPPVSPRIDQLSTPDKENRSFKNSMSPTSPSGNRDFSKSKVTKKLPSPRTEWSISGRRTPSARTRRSEGDNDSGVDESTQGNDQSSNGEHASPKKTPSKVSSSKLPSSKCRTPVKGLQSPKSPDPANTPTSADKKKLPMNKIQVGSAPSPNIKTVKSKIGSLDNASYKPGGGKIRVENRKIDFSKVQPKIAAKNDAYTPSGGEKKIQQQKLQWNAKSKVGSLENATYKPGGGDKKIKEVKLDFKEKAKPKVGSKDNIKHQPGGGDVKSVDEEMQDDIETRKLEIQAQSKIGSLDNVKHKPGGGEIKIFDDKDYLKQRASDERGGTLSGSQEEDFDRDFDVYPKKRSSNVKPPATLNISSSASPKRRVRYLDFDGPRSLIEEIPQSKSLDYQRPMSACGSFIRKQFRARISYSISDRPPWRY